MKLTGRALKVRALSDDYGKELGAHLNGGRSSLKKASVIGKRAAGLKLETLDLARIHEQALGMEGTNSDVSRKRLAKAAEPFFMEANLQIEQTHLAAAKASLQYNRINATLKARTNELAISIRDVKKRMGQRKAAEGTLKSKNARYARLLKESRMMQTHLRNLAHRVLLAQENERGQISRELHDEIGQAILGIHMRLLTLEQQGTGDAKKLLQDIATAERLVNQCVGRIRQAARKLGRRHGK